jgi:hypothetical protein
MAYISPTNPLPYGHHWVYPLGTLEEESWYCEEPPIYADEELCLGENEVIELGTNRPLRVFLWLNWEQIRTGFIVDAADEAGCAQAAKVMAQKLKEFAAQEDALEMASGW